MFDNCFPVVFGEYFRHRDVEERLLGMSGVVEATSAGFIRQDALGEYSAFGESISLNLKSQSCDSTIINNILRE
jgi:hypothetical protein